MIKIFIIFFFILSVDNVKNVFYGTMTFKEEQEQEQEEQEQEEKQEKEEEDDDDETINSIESIVPFV